MKMANANRGLLFLPASAEYSLLLIQDAADLGRSHAMATASQCSGKPVVRSAGRRAVAAGCNVFFK